MTRAAFSGVPQSDYRLIHPEKKRGKFILTIRTDSQEAEVVIFDSQKELDSIAWHAHRSLAVTLNKQIKKVLLLQGYSLQQLGGIVVFSGPGSFTGLRIGATVASTLAYSLDIPVVGLGGEKWQQNGIKDIESGKDDKIVVLEYGAPAKTTLHRK